VEETEMENAVAEKIISELQAIDIAESVIEGIVIEMELDKNDGLYVYELELITCNGKAEVDVNAMTGEVLNMKK